MPCGLVLNQSRRAGYNGHLQWQDGLGDKSTSTPAFTPLALVFRSWFQYVSACTANPFDAEHKKSVLSGNKVQDSASGSFQIPAETSNRLNQEKAAVGGGDVIYFIRYQTPAPCVGCIVSEAVSWCDARELLQL